MTHNFTITGAGIVGLATALKLLESSIFRRDAYGTASSIQILEKEKDVAKHQTGNNSGVIHSGIYYKPGSLKAENCVKGYKMLLEFCDKHAIPYDLCGKVIVAKNENELPYLQTLYQLGIENGLENLKKDTGETFQLSILKVGQQEYQFCFQT